MKFPRLFWKIFFAMWLSIMAFAVLVSLINQRLINENAFEPPGRGFEVNLKRFKEGLSRDLDEGGEQQVVESLNALSGGLRKHIYVLDPAGRELLERNRTLERIKRDRVRVAQEKITLADGTQYTLLSANRRPPRAILAPNARGVELRLIVAALISALVSWLLAHYLARPLGQLSKASKQLATGDLTVRVGPPLTARKDEFGQLASDLDEMAGRLEISQQANRRLLRDVSHELRSPLARLTVALEIARNKDKNQQSQSKVADELNRIELESNRLEQLVDEVLSLLRETSGSLDLNLQPFNMAELLTDLIDTVNYEIPDGKPLIKLKSDAALPIDGDRELLWRVFENLLRNALLHGDANDVEVDARQIAGGRLLINVQDKGPGIAEQHLKQVFDPFYRVDESRNRGTQVAAADKSGGHGLGLAIAASAIRRHGGRIEARNVEGGGLQVTVELPQRQPSSSA